MAQRKLYRSTQDRVVAGVAGGLGEYFDMDANIIRIGFVLLACLGGAGAVLYFACWMVLPEKNGRAILSAHDSVEEQLERAGEELKKTPIFQGFGSVLGVWLIIIGLVVLLINLGYLAASIVFRLWPLLLIVLGWYLYVRSSERKK